MKILLICPTSNQIITFRKSLIEKFQSEGFEVFSIAFDEEQRDILESRGIKHFCVRGANRSLNPFKIITLKNSYAKIIKQVQPDIVFTFMLKPNIYGVRAAKKAKVAKTFSMVEGAGDVFIKNGLKWKLIRKYVCREYRRAFKLVNKVFFLNSDDKSEFISRKLVKEEQSVVIPGIGVDLEHFAFKPIKNYSNFLMIARMLESKGVFEYCQAARKVKEKYPEAVFSYLGAEGTVKVSDIQEYIDDGSIKYLGTTNDVRPFLEDCSVYVLPSYREGMPMSVMEAEAVGRAVIASDVPGCRETVLNGSNGFLVPKSDYLELSNKMTWCLEHSHEVEQFGGNSRKLAEEKFDKKKINEILLNYITVSGLGE